MLFKKIFTITVTPKPYRRSVAYFWLLIYLFIYYFLYFYFISFYFYSRAKCLREYLTCSHYSDVGVSNSKLLQYFITNKDL